MPRWGDSIFDVQKMLQGRRQQGGQLLPGEDGEAGAERSGFDGGHDLEPGFAEVGAAGVVENAEARILGVGGEDVADQLVAGVGGDRGVWGG